MWLLRLAFDPLGTLAGLRRWILVVAPVAPGTRAANAMLTGQPGARQPSGHTSGGVDSRRPGHALVKAHALPAPSRPALAPGENKREAMIRLYEQRGQEGDPRYRDPAKAARVAGEIAGQIGYHPGTARRELTKYLAALPPNGHAHQPDADPQAGIDAEEVL
jgi:hypothetical protein